MSSSAQILPAGAGYGVVIGVGFFFAFVSFRPESLLFVYLLIIMIGNDGHLPSPEQIYTLQHQDQRGVQYCFSKHKARAHRLRNCLCLDLFVLRALHLVS